MPTRFVIALLLALNVATSYASDWQYAGYSKSEGNDTHMFYDADGVQHPSKDVVRYWLKAITQDNLDRYYKKHEKEVVEKSAWKIAVGYTPRFYKLEAIKSQYKDTDSLKDAVIGATSYEIIANSNDALVRTKIYFELNCPEHKT